MDIHESKVGVRADLSPLACALVPFYCNMEDSVEYLQELDFGGL